MLRPFAEYHNPLSVFHLALWLYFYCGNSKITKIGLTSKIGGQPYMFFFFRLVFNMS